MTHGGIHQLGAGQGPPLEPLAAQTLAAMRGASRPPVPRPLTSEERAEAEEAARANRYCLYCGGFHAAPSTPACPRLSGGKLDGDGKLVEFTFWPGRDWAEGRVVFAEDAMEEATGDNVE